MKYNSKSYLYLRGLLFLAIFLILHYAYDWFPNFFFQIFSGINESNYQHWKIGFYSYVILSLIESALFQRSLDNKSQFVYTHLMGAILIPWMIFMLWYIAPALLGQFTRVWVEILYANIVTYASILMISKLEVTLLPVTFSRSVKIGLWLLFCILIMEFTIFTFRLPWVDVFAEPVF